MCAVSYCSKEEHYQHVVLAFSDGALTNHLADMKLYEIIIGVPLTMHPQGLVQSVRITVAVIIDHCNLQDPQLTAIRFLVVAEKDSPLLYMEHNQS